MKKLIVLSVVIVLCMIMAKTSISTAVLMGGTFFVPAQENMVMLATNEEVAVGAISIEKLDGAAVSNVVVANTMAVNECESTVVFLNLGSIGRAAPGDYLAVVSTNSIFQTASELQERNICVSKYLNTSGTLTV